MYENENFDDEMSVQDFEEVDTEYIRQDEGMFVHSFIHKHAYAYAYADVCNLSY